MDYELTPEPEKDLSQAPVHESQTTPNDTEKVGTIKSQRIRGIITWLVFMSVLFISIYGGAKVLRVAQRVSWNANFNWFSGSQSQIEVIEFHGNTVLMFEKRKDSSIVYVQKTGEVGWRNISMHDFTPSKPSLSPDENKVAYLSGSKSKDINIIIVPLYNSNLSGEIKIAEITTFLKNQHVTTENLTICPWDFFHWSPNSNNVAIFACYKKDSKQYAIPVIINIAGGTLRIVWSQYEAETQKSRKLIWIDEEKLVLTNFDTAINVERFEIVTVKYAYP